MSYSKSTHKRASEDLQQALRNYENHRQILLKVNMEEKEITYILNSLWLLCKLLETRVENFSKRELRVKQR